MDMSNEARSHATIGCCRSIRAEGMLCLLIPGEGSAKTASPVSRARDADG